MTNIHLFGSRTNTIRALLRNKKFTKKHKRIFYYSRTKSGKDFLDLSKPNEFDVKNFNKKSLIVSCAPIWLFVYFLEGFFSQNKNLIKNINGIIVLSSSSLITKRFSNCKYDQDLYKKLSEAESKLENFCNLYKVNCVIIRPTLIYGNVGKFKDNNLSKIKKLLFFFPFLPFPNDSGYRQPIHVTQLATLIFHYINILEKFKENYFKKITVGGDSIITYKSMLMTLNDHLREGKCKILIIPPRLFYFSLSLLLFFNPRFFASVQRIASNLSGFVKVSEILGIESQDFPLDDL